MTPPEAEYIIADQLVSARRTQTMHEAVMGSGQKLRLIGAGENPVENQIVNTRTLADQIFEGEVAVAVAVPPLWRG